MFEKDPSQNILGEPLVPCSNDPLTGFFRDGCCNTCAEDHGSHTVCAVLTAEFLAYSKYVGNDLSTPRPEYRFPGLKPGDRWCLCAGRFMQAHEEGCAPRVRLSSTHHRAVYVGPLAVVMSYPADEASSPHPPLVFPRKLWGFGGNAPITAITACSSRPYSTLRPSGPDISNPRCRATVKMSLSPRPHIFMQMM